MSTQTEWCLLLTYLMVLVAKFVGLAGLAGFWVWNSEAAVPVVKEVGAVMNSSVLFS